MINSKTDNKNSECKSRLLDLFRESEGLRIKKFISGIELGDMKPSQQLRHLQHIFQFTTDIKHIKGTDNIVADALSRADAITIIDYEVFAKEQMENWIVRFGAPHKVISDQGKQFTSQLFKDLTTLCGIKLRHSTAYHPQCNGKIERLHRTIKIAIHAHNNIKWTETLPTVLLGLRAAINKDNNHSLSQMVYGKTIRQPGGFFDDSKHHLDAEEFVQQLQKQMELPKPLNEKHHSKTKVFVHKDLKTCSHVFIRKNQANKPLESPYEGPFPVLARTGKYFRLKVKGRNVTISINRLRTVHLLTDSDNLTSEHPPAARPIVSGALPSTSS
ncbi:hypothetical protein LAZ67_21001622 [Cordylochernes scorpioides]|uniref:Integrase catalytic domain-containing protein n=1 Tax=Cordylochernes scorpioides TaxID=51811 RepID=A0ABY6LS00_9ARAC|nr:hypothetical protein LAZ67_21001622 [Cordylochernes scorpioides]